MTEYWVSQAKFYCKYCNFYINDTKTARAQHDSSDRHKNSIQIYHKKKREKSLHGAQSEADLQNTLAEIERAAHAAMAQDRIGAPQYKNEISQPPKQTHHQHSGQHSGQQYASSAQQSSLSSSSSLSSRPSSLSAVKLSQRALELISENLRDEKGESGVYTVRGVTYLEGQYHEDRLVTGMKCEIFIEAEDEWCSGEILRCLMHAVPHTDITQRTYDVKYLLPNESETVPSKEVLENGIKSDRIRLIRSPTTSSASASAAIVQETTGLGKWQTVSVRIINEEEEYERQKQQEREDREEQERIKEEQRILNENLLLEAGEGEDSLSSFDPYNTGIYRGVDISGNQSRVTELESLTDGKEVLFKKRKDGNEQKKVRNIRRKTGNDEGGDS